MPTRITPDSDIRCRGGESAHTPGPWSVQRIFIEGDGWRVAQMMSNNLSLAESEANARLIAAAPELLAALQEFVRIYEESELRASDGGELVSAIRDAIKVIAKATQS